MPIPLRCIQSFSSLLLAVLLLLLGALAVHRDALAVPVKKNRTVVAQASHHGPAYHEVAAHKDSRHPASPAKRRPRAHHPTIVKVAMPARYCPAHIAAAHGAAALMPLASVYRYIYFREINPPPPRQC
jgi:hypothetical protein